MHQASAPNSNIIPSTISIILQKKITPKIKPNDTMDCTKNVNKLHQIAQNITPNCSTIQQHYNTKNQHQISEKNCIKNVNKLHHPREHFTLLCVHYILSRALGTQSHFIESLDHTLRCIKSDLSFPKSSPLSIRSSSAEVQNYPIVGYILSQPSKNNITDKL